jgi:hypothetical protein
VFGCSHVCFIVLVLCDAVVQSGIGLWAVNDSVAEVRGRLSCARLAEGCKLQGSQLHCHSQLVLGDVTFSKASPLPRTPVSSRMCSSSCQWLVQTAVVPAL